MTPPRIYHCAPCAQSFPDGLSGYLNHRHQHHDDGDALSMLLDLSIRAHDDYQIKREAEHGIRLTELYLRQEL